MEMRKKEKDVWVEEILKVICIEKMSLTDEQLEDLRAVIQDLYDWRGGGYDY